MLVLLELSYVYVAFGSVPWVASINVQNKVEQIYDLEI
jgi:hypothetical protein